MEDCLSRSHLLQSCILKGDFKEGSELTVSTYQCVWYKKKAEDAWLLLDEAGT